KLLQEQVKDKESEIKKIQSKLKDISCKKQELEILDLEYGISLKKKHIEELESNILLKRVQISERKKCENDNFKVVYKENSAMIRVKNYLSYKLGQAMIVNSKSILGYIRMPFVLSYIYDKHKQEQKIYQEKIKKDSSLILPPLESYPDYKEALKEKECLTYKLGQALIKANKTWYGGGYIKLLFEIRKLKRK
ncbi:sugar transferase, partial [Campylobacter lari]